MSKVDDFSEANVSYSQEKERAIKLLRDGGIANPMRMVRLIREVVLYLQLDLSGLVVLTEAASASYAVTPIIASMAGASRVIAVTQNSSYASAETVIAQTRALENLCDIKSTVEIHTTRSPSLYSQADIVTNLGFVRPISAGLVHVMRPTAVVPLMFESWEFRPNDIDLAACRDKGILVLGTDEGRCGIDVFAYTGNLCLKMLFDAQVEVYKSNVLIVSSDKFGPTIEQAVTRAGASACLVNDLRSQQALRALGNADAIVLADYQRTDVIIGEGGDIATLDVAALSPNLTIVQFAGVADVAGLQRAGLFCYPARTLQPRRMAFTLMELGPRPVVELHAAGFKVGEIAARFRQNGLSASETEEAVLRVSPLPQIVAAR